MENPAESLEIAQKYFEALSVKDINALVALCDDKVTVNSPLGSLEGIEAFRGFADGFAKMIEKLTPVSILGWEGKATVVYLADTLPVKQSYVAEALTIENGKIIANVTIYNAIPYMEYAASQQKH